MLVPKCDTLDLLKIDKTTQTAIGKGGKGMGYLLVLSRLIPSMIAADFDDKLVGFPTQRREGRGKGKLCTIKKLTHAKLKPPNRQN